MTSVIAVLRKEWRDVARDRRSLVSGLFYGVWGPLVMGLALVAMARAQADIGRMPLVVDAPARASSLMAYLASRDVDIVAAGGADLAADVRAKRVPVALAVDERYPHDFDAQRPAELTLIFDGSSSESARRAARIRALLADYARQVGDARLVLRGVAPSAIGAVRVNERDYATAAGRAAGVLATMPIFVLLAAFVGGMSVAADLTAGERERGTLESLLVHPPERGAIVAGKWLAVSSVAVATVGVTVLVSQAVLLHPRLQAIDLPIGLPARDAALILLLLTPLAMCASAVQMLVALFARTYKEAQTQLSFLVFAPMLPGFLFAFGSLQPEPWMALTPMLGQHVFLSDIVRGASPPWGAIGVLSAVTMGVAAAALLAVARLLGRESILRRHDG